MQRPQCMWCGVGSARTNLYPSFHLSKLPFQQKDQTKQVKFPLRLPNQLRSRSYQALAASLLVVTLLDDLEHHLRDTAARFPDLLENPRKNKSPKGPKERPKLKNHLKQNHASWTVVVSTTGTFFSSPLARVTIFRVMARYLCHGFCLPNDRSHTRREWRVSEDITSTCCRQSIL